MQGGLISHRAAQERAAVLSLRFVGTPYGDDNITLLVSSFDIAVRLDDLLRRIDTVNGRFELARLDQFFEQQQVFELVAAV